MKKDADNTIAHMYLVPHFHYDVAWVHTEEEEEKRGASLVKQFCVLKQGRISNVLTHVKKENILSSFRFTPIPAHGEKLLLIEEAGNQITL